MRYTSSSEKVRIELNRPLDFMITGREIRKAAENLKNNRSPFSDKITNEMIKASIDTLMPVYEKLFNSILKQGIMSQTKFTRLHFIDVNQ